MNAKNKIARAKMNAFSRAWLMLYSGFLLLCGIHPALPAENLRIKVGDPFPAWNSYTWEGTPPAEWSGKLVLVDFWASWCPPCKESFPALASLSRELGPQGLVVVGINLDEDRSAMEKFLKKRPIDFTILREKEFKLAKSLSIQGMPTTILIGRDGKVRMIHQGYEGHATAKKLKEEIQKCL